MHRSALLLFDGQAALVPVSGQKASDTIGLKTNDCDRLATPRGFTRYPISGIISILKTQTR